MSSYIKGNEIVIKTAEQLMAFARDCRLAALREVREMVLTMTVRDGCTAVRISEAIDALIKREEEGR